MTDPKPPEQTPAPSPGSAPPKPYISPKLREKLEGGGGADEEWSPKSGPPVAGIVITLLVVGAGIAGLFWLRSSSDKRKAEEAVQAHADSVAAAAHAESLAVAMAARTDSLAKADSTATRPAGSARPSASTAPGGTAVAPGSAPTPPAPASDGFGVAIGSYMSEDRANGERDRLAGVTGLPGLVTPRDDGGTTVYRVILGKFASRAAAERKGQALMDSSLVREANVVARPK